MVDCDHDGWVKILGLLGGMSWESTIEYYRSANEETRAWGGLHSAPLLLWSADFVEIEEFQAAGSWEEAGSRLAAAAQALEGAGAELLVLRTNTTHKVAGVIEASVSIPLVHIVDSVAAGVLAAGMQRVGLLGTRFTMEEPFWAERMATTGSSACARTARPGQRPHGHHDELCLGCSPKDPGRPIEIIQRLVSAGAQGVVLGCTEIEFLIRPEDTSVLSFLLRNFT